MYTYYFRNWLNVSVGDKSCEVIWLLCLISVNERDLEVRESAC